MRLYLFAMLDEAKDVVVGLKRHEKYPFPLYKNDEKLIAITGIGKVNSSFVASYLSAKYQIKEIINIGFVGAFGDFYVGETVLVSKAIYHDVDATMFGYKKGQVPNMPEFYQSDKTLQDKFPSYKRSTLFTGDYFMTSEISLDFIADMEATAIFQVGHRLNIPVLSVKIVSDLIGSIDHLDEYKEFEKQGSKNIFDIYLKIEEVLK